MADKRILIVEDDADNTNLVRMLLERENYAVISAENGQKGFEVGKAELPDLIILDLDMPIMDGLEFVEEVRNGDDETKDIPIVMVTTEGGDSKVAESVAAGANGHVKKPFTAEDLQSALGKFLS